MRLYHGTSAWAAIRKHGIDPAPKVRTFGEDELGLESLGGAYLSDSLEAAGFYAVKSVSSNGWTHGCDPCFFAVEVDESVIIPDEDKIGAVVRTCAAHYGRARRWDADGTIGMLERRRNDFISLLKLCLRLPASVDPEMVWKAAEAHIRREAEDGWPDGGRKLADQLCEAARATLDHEWFREEFGGSYWFTCRTMERLAETGTLSRIVGGARLGMSADGMSITDVETFGDIADVEAACFKDAAIANFHEIQSVEIADETGRASGMAYA